MNLTWWRRWGMTAAGLLFLAATALPFWKVASVSGSSGMLGGFGIAIATVMIALILAFIAALFLAYAWTPDIADRFTFGLLAPRVYLKTAPHLLSRAEGLINAADYAAAERELRDIIDRDPACGDAVRLLGGLYLDRLRRPEDAAAVLEGWLAVRARVFPGDSATIVLLCDALAESSRLPDAVALLRQEIKRRGYPTHERDAMRRRLDAIAR